MNEDWLLWREIRECLSRTCESRLGELPKRWGRAVELGLVVPEGDGYRIVVSKFRPARDLLHPDTREAVVRRDGLRCQLCRKILERREVEIDHVRPVAFGGDESLENLRVACRRCNRTRSKPF